MHLHLNRQIFNLKSFVDYMSLQWLTTAFCCKVIFSFIGFQSLTGYLHSIEIYNDGFLWPHYIQMLQPNSCKAREKMATVGHSSKYSSHSTRRTLFLITIFNDLVEPIEYKLKSKPTYNTLEQRVEEWWQAS